MIRLSLLDRLCSTPQDHRGNPLVAEGGVFVPLESYVETVKRDLQWLFNTLNAESASPGLCSFPRVQASVLNFGVADITGRMPNKGRDPIMEQRLRDAVQRFEPRLRPDSLRIEYVEPTEGEASAEPWQQRFSIVGELQFCPIEQEDQAERKEIVIVMEVDADEVRCDPAKPPPSPSSPSGASP